MNHRKQSPQSPVNMFAVASIYTFRISFRTQVHHDNRYAHKRLGVPTQPAERTMTSEASLFERQTHLTHYHHS